MGFHIPLRSEKFIASNALARNVASPSQICPVDPFMTLDLVPLIRSTAEATAWMRAMIWTSPTRAARSSGHFIPVNLNGKSRKVVESARKSGIRDVEGKMSKCLVER